MTGMSLVCHPENCGTLLSNSFKDKDGGGPSGKNDTSLRLQSLSNGLSTEWTP